MARIIHCWRRKKTNIFINSVRVDNWTAERAIIVSDEMEYLSTKNTIINCEIKILKCN